MPRKKIILTADYPFHVSARCVNKEWFQVPIEQVWEIFNNYLFFIHHAYQVEIISFVLMNNHFHLLLRTPKANLDRAMNYLMRETSRSITKAAGRINQTYGGPYYWSVISKNIYFLNVYKYIYRNPVEAGLAHRVEEYPFSTLAGKLGLSPMIIPIANDPLLFKKNFQVEPSLNWLNQSVEEKYLEEVRRALRRNEFKFSKDRKGNESKLNHITI